MKYLYNKIYEAINTGIQKALILDQDVSMNYQNKPICNNSDLIHYYVSEIIKGNNVSDNYYQILEIYKANKKAYVVADLSELNAIYTNLKKDFGINQNILYTDISKELINIDLTWIDTSNALLLFNMYNDKNLYSFHQYDYKTFHQCDFIQLKIDKDKSLYLSRFDQMPGLPMDKWHTEEIDSNGYFNLTDCIKDTNDIFLYTDLNGYEHTYKNPNINYSEIQQYPILDYIINMRCDNSHLVPYLPAISELLYCSLYQDIINYAFILMGNTDELLSINGTMDWWSSTELDRTSAWYISEGFESYQDKKNECHAFPLFKKIF